MAKLDEHSDGEKLEAPARLVSALSRLPAEPVFIPRTVDEAVLKAARKHLSRNRVSHWTWFRPRFWLAAAGVIFLATLSIMLFPKRPEPKPAAFAREDLNRDGRVDIIDALVLARKIEDSAIEIELDLNGDGVVDQKDAATLAGQAVRLDKGGRS